MHTHTHTHLHTGFFSSIFFLSEAGAPITRCLQHLFHFYLSFFIIVFHPDCFSLSLHTSSSYSLLLHPPLCVPLHYSLHFYLLPFSLFSFFSFFPNVSSLSFLPFSPPVSLPPFFLSLFHCLFFLSFTFSPSLPTLWHSSCFQESRNRPL